MKNLFASKKNILLLGLMVVGIGYALSRYYPQWIENQKIKIHVYENDKDYQSCKSILEKNIFWIAEDSEFNIHKFLTIRAPGHDPARKGTAKMDVISYDGKNAGLISYFKKSPRHGFIWILAVDKEFRGKGLGSRLVENALKNLRAMKADYVTLHTRMINKPALALYKKFGFVEKTRYEKRGLVTLILRFK